MPHFPVSPIRHSTRTLHLLAAVLALFLPVFAARAQPSSDPASAIADPVKVESGEFGVGNVSRAGEWCGVRLKLTDSASKQRDVLIRVVQRDADGDRAAYTRTLTLNPGLTQDAWVYFRLPFWFRTGDTMLVLVNEPIPDERAASGYRPGRLLARRQILPGGRVQDSGTPLFGVIGPGEMGLRQYASLAQGGAQPHPALAHEAIESVPGLTAKGLPDRWMGLAPFETIVWGDSASGSETDVSQLRGERTRAMKEWVQRGGHLVIVLPPSGQSWTNVATNELLDILPAVNITRHEGVDLSEYRSLLLRGKDAVLPRSVVLHTFEPRADAGAGEAIRVLNGPKGDCVVARRLVGIGAVTLIGFDFSSRLFSQGGLVDADVFWHRILGKRGILTPDQKEVVPRGQTYSVDQVISSQIAKRGTAATGVLLGIAVFVVYWLLAGPLGFGVLKARKATRFAWLGFLVTAIGFTGFAFGAATWFRPRHFEASHLTILDHVYGQHYQRARSWLSLMLPTDGSVSVVAPDSEGQPEAAGLRRELGGVLSPWDPVGSSQSSGFMDAREYQVDGRDPTRLDLPSRSTVKQVQLDWAGAPRWKMPRPFHEEGIKADGSKLLGALVHDMPAQLHDVVIAHVVGQQPIGADVRARLVSRVQFWKPPATWSWAPGVPLDLTELTSQMAASGSGELWLSDRVPMSSGMVGMGPVDPGRFKSITEAMTVASLFSELGIPEDAKGQQSQAVGVLRREATQCLDLARWFTEPCIIIIGFVGTSSTDGAPAPIGVSIDGKTVPTSGVTVVRWVFPLPDNPPAQRASDLPDPASSK